MEPFNSTISESKSICEYHVGAPLKTLIGFFNVDLIPYSKKRSYCYQPDGTLLKKLIGFLNVTFLWGYP